MPLLTSKSCDAVSRVTDQSHQHAALHCHNYFFIQSRKKRIQTIYMLSRKQKKRTQKTQSLIPEQFYSIRIYHYDPQEYYKLSSPSYVQEQGKLTSPIQKLPLK